MSFWEVARAAAQWLVRQAPQQKVQAMPPKVTAPQLAKPPPKLGRIVQANVQAEFRQRSVVRSLLPRRRLLKELANTVAPCLALRRCVNVINCWLYVCCCFWVRTLCCEGTPPEKIPIACQKTSPLAYLANGDLTGTLTCSQAKKLSGTWSITSSSTDVPTYRRSQSTWSASSPSTRACAHRKIACYP